MAITPTEIYSNLIDQPFDDESYTKELEGNNKEIEFKKGSKVVKVRTVTTAGAVTDHNATQTISQQMAGITNVDSTIATYTLDQQKDIKKFLDKTVAVTNNSIVEGGKILHAIVADFLKVRGYLINARLFRDNCIAYVNNTTADNIRSANIMTPFTGGLEKSMRTGDIGMLYGAKVKEVPADLMPTKVGLILVNPDIVSAPRFLDDSKVSESSVAFGTLVLGLYMYTCVVSTPRNKGVAIIATA